MNKIEKGARTKAPSPKGKDATKLEKLRQPPSNPTKASRPTVLPETLFLQTNGVNIKQAAQRSIPRHLDEYDACRCGLSAQKQKYHSLFQHSDSLSLVRHAIKKQVRCLQLQRWAMQGRCKIAA